MVELTDVAGVRTASMESVEALKRRTVYTRLHGATSKKTIIFCGTRFLLEHRMIFPYNEEARGICQ